MSFLLAAKEPKNRPLWESRLCGTLLRVRKSIAPSSGPVKKKLKKKVWRLLRIQVYFGISARKSQVPLVAARLVSRLS
jgi:hypothetical protein